MNREEQEQFSWVRMSHFNDPRDDASHIICNYDGIDLVRGARRRSAKLDFEKFFFFYVVLKLVTRCDTRSFILYPPSIFRYLGIYISKIWMWATDGFFLCKPQGGGAERWPSGLAPLSERVRPSRAPGSESSLLTLRLGRTRGVGARPETLGHLKKTGAVNIAALVKQQPWPALRADFCVKLPFNIHHTTE